MEITNANYHADRTHLTASMAIAFKRSKTLYRRRFLENAEFKPTASIKVGCYVDSIATGEPVRYALTPAEQRDADGFLAALKALPVWPELEASRKQVILKGTVMKIPVKGKPDFLLPDRIVDLKISSLAKVEGWYWNTLRRGYHIQAGAYTNLEFQATGKKKPFYHLVGWKEDDIYRFKLFLLPDSMVTDGWNDFHFTVQRIKNCVAFNDPSITWDKAEELVRPGSDAEVDDEN